ncbi:putative DNA-binding protein [Mycoplasma testudineum]|uniref:Putative DNA-binding protein n=1 Tax=Mycoplasma testudineum TaxID=244584 RepID=A0A4R6IB69_9MOLU|nr:RNA-binding domain-containing protein [Mycoplasma testudineum]OYD26617.1 hypothetical protein CG473_03215 [Mycoplasma testudineum]TDO19453.1 putative DNA-binding protein [Mycoplasma testudineum]
MFQFNKSEDQDSEFKMLLPVSSRKWLKTLVGYLNSGKEGSIYFGVNDNGVAVGLQYFNSQSSLTTNVNEIHICLNSIEKCVDRTVIFIAEEIQKRITPELLPYYYSINVISKNPFVIELKSRRVTELVYGIKPQAGEEIKYYLRGGSQTRSLNFQEIEQLRQIRQKEINFQYLNSPIPYLAFQQLYNLISPQMKYKEFIKKSLYEEGFVVPGLNYWNYESYLLSDKSSAKVVINNFTNKLNDKYNHNKTIVENLSLPLLLFEVKSILSNLWDQVNEPNLLNELIENSILNNDYYDFANNSPTIEIFYDKITITHYDKFDKFEKYELNRRIVENNLYPNLLIYLRKNNILNYSNKKFKKLISKYGDKFYVCDRFSITFTVFYK